MFVLSQCIPQIESSGTHKHIQERVYKTHEIILHQRHPASLHLTRHIYTRSSVLLVSFSVILQFLLGVLDQIGLAVVNEADALPIIGHILKLEVAVHEPQTMDAYKRLKCFLSQINRLAVRVLRTLYVLQQIQTRELIKNAITAYI